MVEQWLLIVKKKNVITSINYVYNSDLCKNFEVNVFTNVVFN